MFAIMLVISYDIAKIGNVNSYNEDYDISANNYYNSSNI